MRKVLLIICAGVLMTWASFVFDFDNVEASVVEKLTELHIYPNQESRDASTIASFNNGGTPGLILSASKVVIGDSLYVGSSEADSVRVLTEDDLESIKKDIYDQMYEQIYSELKERGCLE